MKDEQGERLIKQKVDMFENETSSLDFDSERLWAQLQKRQPRSTIVWRRTTASLAAAMLLLIFGFGLWKWVGKQHPPVKAVAVHNYRTDTARQIAYSNDENITAGMDACPEVLMGIDATIDCQIIY